MTDSGAWIQSEDENPALLLDNGQVVPTEQETKRQEIVQRISRVTSEGRRTMWGPGVTTYVIEGDHGTYDVVFEAPVPGAVDARGRGVMSSLMVCSVTASDVDRRLAALREALLDRGISLAPLPEDFVRQVAGLMASWRRGCLAIRRIRQHIEEV